MRISGDAYFDKEHLMDIKVMGTMGLTEEDVEAIEDVDGIELAEVPTAWTPFAIQATRSRCPCHGHAGTL